MSTTAYRANTRDIRFVLWEQLGIERLFTCPRYRDFNRETLDMVIEQAARFAEQELGPANAEGDRVGCRFEKGKVYAPPHFRDLLRTFREAGWVTLSSDPEVGGQGLPYAVTTAVNECFMGANFSFCSYPMLAFGAGHLIESFGTERQKRMFMLKMYAGQWGGTMCLTEPQAGSALADIKTVAKRAGDHFLISGTKVFITSGDHDLMENIVHTVLARVEGAPPGVKGLSLFIVPKIRVNEDGSLGEPNDVTCGGIEHKIGLHGSATCVLNFGENGDCHGYLLGGENQGLSCMFQLMNEARIEVGLQGVAQSSAAYLNALAYAKERIQGVDVRAVKDPHAPRVEIIKHPDVRRNLLCAKAHVEGMRSLLLYTAFLIDLSHCAATDEERSNAHLRVELLTPVCKAYCSDTAFRMIELALQVFGGYGVCSEYPVEQYLRDCKIASIYEGTNGIQALDLLGRKMGMKGGKVFMDLMEEIGDLARRNEAHPGLGAAFKQLALAKDKLAESMMHLGMLSMSGDILYPVLNASPFLTMFGNVLIAYLLLWQAVVAWGKLSGMYPTDGGGEEERSRFIEANPEAAFYSGKIEAARFFAFAILPQVDAVHKAIMAGDRSALTIAESAF
jgi:alkylation response protein AidB-like acyl-CoA dehydrogenase